MFPSNSIRSEESDSETENSTVYIDSFTSLIRKAVGHKIRLLDQKNRQALVLKTSRPSFSKEIRCMMHIYGDVENPMTESVRLVEKCVRNQMNLLLEKATRVSLVRAKSSITHEELVYLLRNKKDKLLRLFNYLNIKDANECISKKKYYQISGVVYDQGKRVKMCVNFLNKLKGTDEFDRILNKAYVDPVTSRRMKMRYFRTLEMEDDEYLEYSKKLLVSFSSGGGIKFKKWLLADNVTDLVPTDFALEIISYFARETVGEIVESSKLIQLNDYRSGDPNRRPRTTGFKMFHMSEPCTDYETTANSSVLNEELMDNISADCINDYMDHSDERSRESFLPNNSKVDSVITNDDQPDIAEVNHLDLLAEYSTQQNKVTGKNVHDARNLPILPRSIREVMLRSTMSQNYLKKRVKGKLKGHLLCL